MNPLKTTILFTAVLVCSASIAVSDQYIIQLDAPLAGDDAALLRALELVEVDVFDYGEKSFVVFEANGDGYIEAYFKAKHIRPNSVMVLPQNWTDTSLDTVSIAAKMEILTTIACDFCSI